MRHGLGKPNSFSKWDRLTELINIEGTPILPGQSPMMIVASWIHPSNPCLKIIQTQHNFQLLEQLTSWAWILHKQQHVCACLLLYQTSNNPPRLYPSPICDRWELAWIQWMIGSKRKVLLGSERKKPCEILVEERGFHITDSTMNHKLYVQYMYVKIHTEKNIIYIIQIYIYIIYSIPYNSLYNKSKILRWAAQKRLSLGQLTGFFPDPGWWWYIAPRSTGIFHQYEVMLHFRGLTS